MPLTKSRGQMYEWVTHTHTHLGGECPHKCTYCYVDNPRFGRPERYRGEVRLIESELRVKYGEGKTIFIGHATDLFANAVPEAMIAIVLRHCCQWPNNTYVFQTKNPGRYWRVRRSMPPKRILGTTVETDHHIRSVMGNTPSPYSRMIALAELRIWGETTFITVEPVLRMQDPSGFAKSLSCVRPAFINIGADSKGHGLPEPWASDLKAFVQGLRAGGVEIRAKRNLARFLKRQGIKQSPEEYFA